MPSERTLLVCILAAVLVVAVAVVSLPVETLVGVVPDDTFYYLAIGRNLAATGVATFDGENPASGFHPAWMTLIVAVALVFPDGVDLLRAVLACSFAFHAASGYLLYRCLRRFVSGRMAAAAAGVWLLGYLPLLLAAFALETSLYGFTFLLSYWVYLRWIDPRLASASRIPSWSLLLFGAALGLCFWARTEAIVLLACAMLWLGLATLAKGGAWRDLFAACRNAIVTGAAAVLVITPYLLYNLLTFGTIRQASGAMKVLWQQEENTRLSLAERVCQLAERYWTWICSSTPWSWGTNATIGAVMGLLWLAVLAAAGVYVARRPAEVRRAVGKAMPAVAYPLLHMLAAGAVYVLFFADAQCWYQGLPYLEFYLALVVVGGTVYRVEIGSQQGAKIRKWRTEAAVVAVVFTALGLVRFVQTFQHGYWGGQREVYASIEAVEALVPEKERIGSFNAGIAHYFGHRPIINLDGLVNDTIVPYWRDRQVDQYLRDARISIILDDDLTLARAWRFMQRQPRLDELARFQNRSYITGTRLLWRVHWDDQPIR